MTVEGHCNCGSIRVVLNETPDACVLCYCDNCRRSGGLAAVNFPLKVSTITIHDPSASLRKYLDKNTASGEVMERQFCGTCGSPILSIGASQPELAWLKASLFNVKDIPAPNYENYAANKPQWMGQVVPS